MEESNNIAVQDSAVFSPKVGACYKNGWHQLWKHFLELFLIGIIALLISLPAGAGGWFREAVAIIAAISFFGFVYSILISGPIDYGMSFAYLKAARGEEVKIKDMFHVFNNYWNAVLAILLVSIIVLIGFILLIVPGIVFACKLAFTPYLVVDRKMDVIGAIKESWAMTKGYSWKVFLIGLLAIPISIAGLICFGVGIIIAIMWIELALASLYHAVCLSNQASSLSESAPHE